MRHDRDSWAKQSVLSLAILGGLACSGLVIAQEPAPANAQATSPATSPTTSPTTSPAKITTADLLWQIDAIQTKLAAPPYTTDPDERRQLRDRSAEVFRNLIGLRDAIEASESQTIDSFLEKLIRSSAGMPIANDVVTLRRSYRSMQAATQDEIQAQGQALLNKVAQALATSTKPEEIMQLQQEIRQASRAIQMRMNRGQATQEQMELGNQLANVSQRLTFVADMVQLEAWGRDAEAFAMWQRFSGNLDDMDELREAGRARVE